MTYSRVSQLEKRRPLHDIMRVCVGMTWTVRETTQFSLRANAVC